MEAAGRDPAAMLGPAEDVMILSAVLIIRETRGGTEKREGAGRDTERAPHSRISTTIPGHSRPVGDDGPTGCRASYRNPQLFCDFAALYGDTSGKWPHETGRAR